ncbi:flagellar M-ring protein FliF C-terminal domain-containing protein [Microcella daejeonensis]|uniref:flagellar M-ring protein FliF C-terminal domain-containing protein n=1 Tax=Microcella daejeonensis TaxID=2994971 RepID=UPI002D1E47D9|nr:flagellar M-ring protein FliF C-terminal domain-containing protein [Microcella daejeonensis]
MVERVVGPGNASVVVSVDVVSESIERTSETYEAAEGAVPLTESTTSEEYTGGAGGAAGVLGPDNIAVPGDEQDAGTYAAETTDRTNANNRVVEVRSIPAGDIGRQTVSVAVDREAAAGTNAAALEALVVTAAGLDVAAGDAVTVELVDFDRSLAEQAEAALGAARAAEEQEALWSSVRWGAIGLGVLILLVVILALVRSAMKRQVREPIDLGILQERHEPTTPVPDLDALLAPKDDLSDIELPVGPSGVEGRRRALNALAQRDPARTADLLRQLMDDRSPV